MGGAFGPIAGILIQFVNFVNGVLVPVIFALAFIVFLWGVYLYFFTTGSDGKSRVKEGKSFIIYGIIGFFVMVTIWGIVNILINSVGLDPRNNRPTPMFITPYGPGVQGSFPGGNQQGVNTGGGSVGGGAPIGNGTNPTPRLQGQTCNAGNDVCEFGTTCQDGTCQSDGTGGLY